MQVGEEVLAHFDGGEGAEKLYHFRFLPAERRAAAATYILERGLDPRVRAAQHRAAADACGRGRLGQAAGRSRSPPPALTDRARARCAQECDVLARAMKEWDRRPSERSGFNDGPGDCMAFKYLRDVRAPVRRGVPGPGCRQGRGRCVCLPRLARRAARPTPLCL